MNSRLVCIISLVFVACSSSGTGGDAEARQDVKGIGGQSGGQSGESGGAGSGGTGSGTSGGGSGGSTSLDPTEVCREARRIQVERLRVCAGFGQEWETATATYMQAANGCPEYSFNPDSYRTVEELANCLPALRAQPCTDLLWGFTPPCYASGKRDNGKACTFNSECKSGICIDTKDCSVCKGGKLAGEACTGLGQCARGFHCTSSGTYADNGTLVHAAEGQPCDLDATPVVGCVGDLYCRIGDKVNVGVCTAPPGAGQRCAESGLHNGQIFYQICAAGTVCVEGTCRPPGGCGGGLTCAAGSRCVLVGTNFTCEPLARAGETCLASRTLGACVTPGICETGTCLIYRALGEHCDDDNPCGQYLVCVDGACAKAPPKTCSP